MFLSEVSILIYSITLYPYIIYISQTNDGTICTRWIDVVCGFGLPIFFGAIMKSARFLDTSIINLDPLYLHWCLFHGSCLWLLLSIRKPQRTDVMTRAFATNRRERITQNQHREIGLIGPSRGVWPRYTTLL